MSTRAIALRMSITAIFSAPPNGPTKPRTWSRTLSKGDVAAGMGC